MAVPLFLFLQCFSSIVLLGVCGFVFGFFLISAMPSGLPARSKRPIRCRRALWTVPELMFESNKLISELQKLIGRGQTQLNQRRAYVTSSQSVYQPSIIYRTYPYTIPWYRYHGYCTSWQPTCTQAIAVRRRCPFSLRKERRHFHLHFGTQSSQSPVLCEPATIGLMVGSGAVG